MYLVDTDVLIDFLDNSPIAVQHIAFIEDAGIAVSVISIGEFYEGIHGRKRNSDYEKRFVAFLGSVSVLVASTAIMKRYAWIKYQLDAAGQPLPDFDIIIAATAIEHDLTLLTRNRRHFERIMALKLYDWATPSS